MRKTEHYRKVLALIQEAKGPLSIPEMLHDLRQTGMGQATIYRAVHKGVDLGELREVPLPHGPLRYEMANLKHHHHFVCKVCDRALDIQGCGLNVQALTPVGFRVDEHEIILRGVCPECQDGTEAQASR
jgi:Fur family ferric uptake transcriptional regulator